MSNVHSISEFHPRSAEPLTFAQQTVLERAVAKIVLLGELVGVSADQMILLLDSGLTVGELLDYLGVRTRQAEVVMKRGPIEVRSEWPQGD
jgi:hypothetical protein